MTEGTPDQPTTAARGSSPARQVWLGHPRTDQRMPVVRGRIVGLGLLVAILVILVALAGRSSVLTHARVSVVPGAATVIGYIAIVVFVIADLLVLGAIVYAVGHRRRRKGDDEAERRVDEPNPVPWAWKLLAAVFPLLMVGGVVLLLVSFHPLAPVTGVHRGYPLTTGPSPIAPHGGNRPETGGIPIGLVWIAVAIALTLAATAGLIVAWSSRLDRREPREKSRLARILATAVDDSVEDIMREEEPRRAVIAAYARLERILAAQGVPRLVHEAPLEYLARVLRELKSDSQAIRALTSLFELAKFGHHRVGSDMKDKAVAALVSIRDGLRSRT